MSITGSTCELIFDPRCSKLICTTRREFRLCQDNGFPDHRSDGIAARIDEISQSLRKLEDLITGIMPCTDTQNLSVIW
jgi:hypothetical protein